MSKIELLVFFHILGAFLICGGAGIGIASGVAMGRTASVKTIGLLSLTAHRAAFVASLPGSLLLIVTGSWLIADYRFFEINEFWLWGSYVLSFVAMALDHGMLGPFLGRIHSRSVLLADSGALESDELRIEAAAPLGRVVGMVLLALLLVALYLMVFRPGH